MELDNAPLPPPVKRGRKPAEVITAAEWPKHVGERIHETVAMSIAESGWTTGAVVNRYPTEGHTMLVGGRFNGQQRDMRPYNGAKFVALPLDNGDVDWYERGERDGYYWVASVKPQGIELRLTL